MSERPDNIFYGDIFNISNKGCLIFGSGKTKACRSAISNDKEEIALDFACITNDENNIYGHFEFSSRHKSVSDPINKRIKLIYLIRMLDMKETLTLGLTDIEEITLDAFIKLSAFNISFDTNVSSMTFKPNANKIDDFKSIVKNKKIKCIIVPWMKSHEEKGLLLKEFIENN